jgi:L-asparaginase / beta-aspartyl-peptidase
MTAYAIVVHAGAGEWDGVVESEAVAGVRESVARAIKVLQANGSALDAVTAAVVEMEDNPLFNAGTGSVLNLEGAVEMDAAVMTGHDLACGAIAALKRVRNPILVALRVMQSTPHVFFAGEGALRFARAEGFEDYDPITPTTLQYYLQRAKAQGTPTPGTVGAVALDRAGRLAAATSTGGRFLKPPGRVGDSPIPGAGTYATARAAASATGHGEWLIRHLATRSVCDLAADGVPAQQAVERVLAHIAAVSTDEAGLIAVTADGGVGVAHGTAAMPHAWMREGDADIIARFRCTARTTDAASAG